MSLRVLHLAGSPVSDFFCDLSRLYAADCLEATSDPERYTMHVAYVTPDGMWRFPTDLGRGALDAAPPVSLAQAVDHLVGLNIDVAVPQMFCPPGMTHYRALLDVLQIPYLGNGPDAMALTMNKVRARAVVAAAGVAVPDGELLRPGDRPAINPPAVVKPVDMDNSVGVTFVADRSGYEAALATGFDQADEVLVEQYIELGREVRCGIIVRDGELVCLRLEEYALDRHSTPIRSYEDKLARDIDGELIAVAKNNNRSWIVDVDDPATEQVWQAARACHVALGCRHYSLFDFRIDPDGRPWFLEAGLYCSFARQSVLCAMAADSGMEPRELFGEVLRNVLP